MLIKRIALGLVSVGCYLFTLTSMAMPSDAPFYFLTLTDIHFDPFSACYAKEAQTCVLINQLRAAPVSKWKELLRKEDAAQPRYRYDTGYVLLQQSIHKAAAIAAERHADFVLVLGDTLGHHMRRYYKKYSRDSSLAGYQAFVKKTLTFINLELAREFPDTAVMMVVGNNDTYSFDYQSEIGGSFFQDAGLLWSALILDKKAGAEMYKQFIKAGYYSLQAPKHPELRLVVLNSVLFSKRSRGEQSAKAAEQQMRWLHGVLEDARVHHQRVLLAMHLPPRLDAFLFRHWYKLTVRQFWRKAYLQDFQQELAQFYPEIRGIFAGHLHYDWQQSLELDAHHEFTILGIPSISPIFGNDPMFKVYQYAPETGKVSPTKIYRYAITDGGKWVVK